MMKTCYV